MSGNRRSIHDGMRVVGLVLLAIGAAATVSCTPPGGGAERAGTDKVAVHGVHSGELRDIMRSLNSRAKEQIAAELYTGSPATPDLSEVATSAEALAKAAEGIPGVMSRVSLTDAERTEFLALVTQLQQQARELQTPAGASDIDKVRAAMNRVDATCNACHTRFRISS